MWRRQTRNDFQTIWKVFCKEVFMWMCLLLTSENASALFNIQIEIIIMNLFKNSHNQKFKIVKKIVLKNQEQYVKMPIIY